MTAATATRDIPSIGEWATNAELIADVAALGWLADQYTVLDATYGLGRFWTEYRPPLLTGVDINPAKSTTGESVDFRALPYADANFDVVVFDPPYKLSGTPALGDFDDAYGIEVATDWRDRMALICEGAAECARVARRHLLVKCQDQVVSGKMRWQTDAVTEVVTALGFRKADRFEFGASGGRPQPGDRRQVHARHSASQLLVFTRGRVDNGFTVCPDPQGSIAVAIGAGQPPAGLSLGSPAGPSLAADAPAAATAGEVESVPSSGSLPGAPLTSVNTADVWRVLDLVAECIEDLSPKELDALTHLAEESRWREPEVVSA